MTMAQSPPTTPKTIPRAASSNRRRELVYFFAGTFAVTWGIAALLLLLPDQTARVFGKMSTSSPLYFLAVYAPSLVALALTLLRRGTAATVGLIATLRPRWAHIPYYLAVLLGWPVLNRLALWLQALITGEATPWLDFSDAYLGPILLVWTLVTDAGPMGEELGWRGYALPRLLAGRLSSLSAAILLGVIWGVWHLPAFFVAGTSQHDDHMGVLWLILGTTLSSVIMTWLYKRTNGDVLASGLLVHLMNNFTSARLPYLDLVYAPLALAAAVALSRREINGDSENRPDRRQ